VFEEQEDPATRSFFSEIIASISDIKFSPDGRYIIARDFLTLKIWDVNMNSRPVQTINVSLCFVESARLDSEHILTHVMPADPRPPAGPPDGPVRE
jgi:WD40 repeat protein